MAKDPAFLFYPNDYLGGTMGMTFEEKGAYLELLIYQFNRGRFTEDDAINLIQSKNWLKIRAKFTKKNEVFYNIRLEAEIDKRHKHSEKQRDNVNKRWEKNVKNGNTVVLPLENENENIIEIEVEDMGVQGEKELTKMEIGKTIEYVDRVKQVKLSEKEVVNFWEAFKLNQAESSYLSVSKKIKHFRDWLKNQQHGSKTNSASNGASKLGTSAARVEALRNWGFG